MRHTVAIATNLEIPEHGLRMRFSMAFAALDDGPVLRMTFGTQKGAVFRVASLKHVISLPVATAACLLGNVGSIDDLHGAMGRMTRKALSLGCALFVWLMALQAFRDGPVSGVVARRAVKLGVLGDIRLHFLVHLGMTYGTALFQLANRRDQLRGVRFVVAFYASYEVRAMNLIVTVGTLGHDCLILCLAGTVDMEFHVALRTVYFMLSPFVLDQIEIVLVTPPALLRPQRLHIRCIGRRLTAGSLRSHKIDQPPRQEPVKQDTDRTNV
jgi:hypothetical protein